MHCLLIMFSFSMFTIQALSMNIDCPIKCPGLYCGRAPAEHNLSSSCNQPCESCSRGFRTNSFHCLKCDSLLVLYDWLFLGFMMICIMVLNFYAVDMFHSTERKSWLFHLSIILESVISFILMILSFEPRVKFSLHSCGVKSIKDWYTVFYNPKPDYVTVIRCTQEAVYPLYTAIFMYLVYCLVLMIIFRGVILPKVTRMRPNKSLYAGLYIIPIVGVVHTCFAGVIYFIYPYLMLFLSVIGVAIFLSTLDQENYFKDLRTPRHVGVLACYCVAHGYGIISITELSVPIRDGPVMLLVFLPVLFYTVSRRFTRVERFTGNWNF